MFRGQHVPKEDLIEEVPPSIQPSQHGASAPVSVPSPYGDSSLCVLAVLAEKAKGFFRLEFDTVILENP
ncbi:hypothetical protein JCM13210_09880 [Thermaerobacter litoralis]